MFVFATLDAPIRSLLDSEACIDFKPKIIFELVDMD